MSFWENPFPPLCITNSEDETTCYSTLIISYFQFANNVHPQGVGHSPSHIFSFLWSPWPAVYNVSVSNWNNFIVTKPTSRRPSCRTSFLGNLLPHSSNFFCRSVPSLSMTMNLYLVGTESFVSRASERLQLYLLLWGEHSCFTLLLIWCFLSSSFQDINTVKK